MDRVLSKIKSLSVIWLEGGKVEIREYFKGVRKRLPTFKNFKKEIYGMLRKTLYIIGVFIFLGIIIEVIQYKINQQQQHRLASFPLLIDGACYCREKQYKKGIEKFQKTIDINPGRDSANAYFGLAYAYQQLGQYGKSIKYYKKVVKLNPNDARAHIELGFALTKQQQQRSAKEVKETINKTLQSEFPNSPLLKVPEAEKDKKGNKQ